MSEELTHEAVIFNEEHAKRVLRRAHHRPGLAELPDKGLYATQLLGLRGEEFHTDTYLIRCRGGPRWAPPTHHAVESGGLEEPWKGESHRERSPDFKIELGANENAAIGQVGHVVGGQLF